MKNLITVVFLGMCIVSCYDTRSSIYKNRDRPNRSTKISKFLERVKVTPDEAVKLVENYNLFIKANPDSSIKQINMDEIELQKFIKNEDGVRFLFAAYSKNGGKTVILNIYNIREKYSLYYNIGSVFNDPSLYRSMREKPFLCPPPSTCEVIIPTPED